MSSRAARFSASRVVASLSRAGFVSIYGRHARAKARENGLEPSAAMEISRHLDSGESLLWSGVPRQGLFLRASDAFLIPFSILWGGFAIFWEVSVVTQGAPLFFALFGVPFVLIGLYLIFGRFFVDARARANTSYGLTDRRAIIVSGAFSRTVDSLPLQGLNHVALRESSDGTGTVLLGRPHPFSGLYAGMQWPGMLRYETPRFERIPDAKRVHDQLLEAQRTAR